MDSEPTTEITIYDDLGHWIIMDVCEPVTITAKEGFGRAQSFTSYLIRLETNHYAFAQQYSAVRRRYSEFCWLKEILQRHHPNMTLPPIPPKKYLNLVRFNPKIIEIRRAGLSKFLEQLLASPIFIRELVLHLFIQTDLSIREMEERLHERLSFSVDSNNSEVGSQRYAISRAATSPITSHIHNSSGVPSSSNKISTNPAFTRSYSIASSGGESAGTTSGEEPSLNSSAATNQSSVSFLRKSRLRPETVSQLLMLQCP